MDDEAMVVWQDVISEVMAGQKSDLSCPHCRHRPLSLEERGRRTRISCSGCGRFIEARIDSD